MSCRKRFKKCKDVTGKKAKNQYLQHDIQEGGGIGACQKMKKKEIKQFLIDEKQYKVGGSVDTL